MAVALAPAGVLASEPEASVGTQADRSLGKLGSLGSEMLGIRTTAEPLWALLTAPMVSGAVESALAFRSREATAQEFLWGQVLVIVLVVEFLLVTG